MAIQRYYAVSGLPSKDQGILLVAAVPPNNAQGSLFGVQSQPVKREESSLSHVEVEETKSQAIYGDLTVDQVFDQVSELAMAHGGTAKNYGWNGAGEIEVFFVSIYQVIDFFKKIDDLCSRYKFRAKFVVETFFDIHPNDSHGIRYKIRSVVPAPITIKE
jgi:hypothetical protein